MRHRIHPALFVPLLVLAACSDDARRRSTPTQPRDPLAGQWQTATVTKSFSLDKSQGEGLVGSWRGTVRVEATSAAPQCSASPWTLGSVFELRGEVLVREDGQLWLDLVQPNESESVCQLLLSVDGNQARAEAWIDFGDGSSCHCELSRAGWSCTEGNGEIWLHELELEGTLSHKKKTLNGTIRARYWWRH